MVLPREPSCGAREGRLLAPGLSFAFPTEVSGCSNERTATRYSGGAAPALHRFPWSTRASNCGVKLCRTFLRGKLARDARFQFAAPRLVFRALRGVTLELGVERGQLGDGLVHYG